MRQLLRKELRALAPLFWLFIALELADVWIRGSNAYLDWFPWSVVNPQMTSQADELGFGYLLLALAMTYTLYPREYDEKTINFLHSLPIPRNRIFWSKIFAALGLMLLVILFEHSIHWFLQSLNPETFARRQFRWDLALIFLALSIAFGAIILCHGMLISYFRRFGMLGYALFWGALILLENKTPALKGINPFQILKVEYHGTTPLLQWLPLCSHAALALVVLFLALRLWNTDEEEFLAIWVRLQEKRLGRALMWLSTIMFIAGLVGFSIFIAEKENKTPEISYPDSPIAKTDTRHFHFAYPSHLRQRAFTILPKADQIYERIQKTLGVKAPQPIIADLTYQGRHALGITLGWKMRVDLVKRQTAQTLLHVLAHETVHTFSFALLGARTSDLNEPLTFYMEGLAEFLAYRHSKQYNLRSLSRLLAAVSKKRQSIRLKHLIDATTFNKTHNEFLLYALGEIWADSLFQICGEKALGGVLKAMTRKKVDKRIRGWSLWQDALQTTECELEQVLGHWDKTLETIFKERQQERETIPRLEGGLVGIHREHILLVGKAIAKRKAKRTQIFLVRVRQGTSQETVKHTRCKKTPKRNSFFCPIPGAFAGNHKIIQYQLCVVFHPGTWPYCERWQSAPIPTPSTKKPH